MSDLLTFVNTPAGQQGQMQYHGAGTIIYAHPDLGKSALLASWRTANFPYDLMAVPHHGQKGWNTLFVTQVEPTVEFNLTSGISNFGYLRERLKHSSDAIRNAVQMDLNIMHGNPVFRGTRIPIYQIIEELTDGTPLAEIPEGYPSLNLEQIQIGLDFAASVLRIYDDQVSDR